MRLYAESSAVLAWLLGEKTASPVRAALQSAEIVIASDLTLVECDRVLVRATALGEMDEGTAGERRRALNAAALRWHILHLRGEIIERARRAFPIEPIRTLDALHLAAVLVANTAIADLEVLSLDTRIRANAHALGLPLQPVELSGPDPTAK